MQRLNDTGENSDWIDVISGSIVFLAAINIILLSIVIL